MPRKKKTTVKKEPVPTMTALRMDLRPLTLASSIMRALLEASFVRIEQPYFDDFVREKTRVFGRTLAQPPAFVSMATLVQWADRFGFEQGIRETDRGR